MFLYRMVKMIVHSGLNPNFIKFGLLISLCLVGIIAWPQRVPKSLWIIFDPSDKLCADMGQHDYRFYQDDKRWYIDLGTPGEIVRFDTLYRLPQNKKIVTRKELFILLDRLPKESDKNGRFFLLDGWYHNAFRNIYVIEKRESYYLKRKVYKIDIFD